jgi:hypothetical protein
MRPCKLFGHFSSESFCLSTAEMVLAIASRNSIFIFGSEPLQPGERLRWFLLSEAALHAGSRLAGNSKARQRRVFVWGGRKAPGPSNRGYRPPRSDAPLFLGRGIQLAPQRNVS